MPSISRRAARLARHAVPVVALAMSLGACSTFSKTPPAFCPRLGLLDGAADLTRFGGSGRDITDIALSGKIQAVPADCRGADNGAVTSQLSVSSTFVRGTATKGREASASYVVTILRGDQIIQQRDVVQPISFPPSIDRVSLQTAPITLTFPAPAEGPANYRVFIGFRLTADELAYNRTHPAP